MQSGNRPRLGHVISRMRRKKAIRQSVLAERVGVDASRMSALENGKRVGATDALVQRIARGLGCSDEELRALQDAATHDRMMVAAERNLAWQEHRELIARALDACQVLSRDQVVAISRAIDRLVKPQLAWNELLSREEGQDM